MSQSTLPDIFKRAQTTPLSSRKQGGQFSLHLTSHSVDKYQPSRAGYAPGDRTYATLNATKRRSVSTASMRPKQSIERLDSFRKVDTAREKMLVSFKQELQFSNVTPLKQKVGLNVMNLSNFPYETHRKMNNMTIDLQQSESLKNKTEFSLKEARVLLSTVQQIQYDARHQKIQFQHFVNTIVKDLQDFQSDFGQVLVQTYEKLSRLRRQTHKQLKQNKTQIQRLQDEYEVCYHFQQDLYKRSSQLYQQCLATQEQTEQRGCSPYLDFEEISSIPKSSRGATGDQTRRKIVDILRKNQNQRRSADFDGLMPKEAIVLNGQQIQLLSLQDC